MSQVPHPYTKNRLSEFIRGILGFRGSGDSRDFLEMVQSRPVWPWVLHALGAKMTIVYTSSFKLVTHSIAPSINLRELS